MPEQAVLFAGATVVSWLALAGVALAAVVLRYLERPIPRWLGWAAALLVGLSVSVMFIIAIRQPPVLLASLVIPAVAAVFLLRQRRFASAGVLLIGLCLPGFAWWGRFMVEDALQPLIHYEPSLLLWWLPELAGLLVGAALLVVGDGRSPPAALFPKPVSLARDPMILANSIYGAMRVGPIDLANLVSVGLGTAVVIVGLPWILAMGLPWPIALGVGAAGYAAIATLLFYPAIPRRLRAAWEGFASVGHPEMQRWRATTGTAVPTSRSAMERWLAGNPDRPETRWARAELLAVAGRLDDARRAAEGMLIAGEADRLEQAVLLAYIDWILGAAPQLDELARLAESVGQPGSEERRLARGHVAIMHARQLAATGGDWMAPLIELRRDTGPIAGRWFRHDTLARRLRSSVLIGLALSGLVLLGTDAIRG